MPNKLQRVLAHGFEISTWGGSVVALGLTGWQGIQIIAAHAGAGATVLVVIALLAAVPLGWLAGGLIVWPLVSGVAAKINGAPFRNGEMVYVLVGPHRGKTAQIYDVWTTRHQARVELGKQAKKDFTDVLMWNQICRAKEFPVDK